VEQAASGAAGAASDGRAPAAVGQTLSAPRPPGSGNRRDPWWGRSGCGAPIVTVCTASWEITPVDEGTAG